MAFPSITACRGLQFDTDARTMDGWDKVSLIPLADPLAVSWIIQMLRDIACPDRDEQTTQMTLLGSHELSLSPAD